MARRARQKRRRAQNPGPRPTQPHRDNVPGELDHASGEVDEFDAALVAGAEGVPVEDDVAADLSDDEDYGDELEPDAVEAGPEARRAVGSSRAPTAHQPVSGRGGGRVIGFLRACVAELQRVQWPDRRQVGQATAVVLGFVVVAGAYLGAADWVAQRIINFIL